MSVYTLEIDGEAILCVCAETFDLAELTIDQPHFRADLQYRFLSGGMHLWDGQEKSLYLRDATEEEYSEVQKRIGASRLTNDPLDENDAILFLVPVSEDDLGDDDDFDDDLEN